MEKVFIKVISVSGDVVDIIYLETSTLDSLKLMILLYKEHMEKLGHTVVVEYRF